MVIPVMWLLQAAVVGGLVVASVAARRWAKRLERMVEDLELERAVFLGILGIARRLVSRYEPLVDEVPYGCLDCGMQVVDGEGRVIGTVLIPPPYSTELARHAGDRRTTCRITFPVARSTRRRLPRLVVSARSGKASASRTMRSHGRSPHRIRGGD